MFLDFIRTRRLRSQITWLFVTLIVLITLAIMLSIWLRTAEYSHNNIERRMDGAQRVLNEYLAAKEQLLITAARVLTADFGFKQAVATRDEKTIVSVLQNHGQRIQADVMMLLNTEGQLNTLAARNEAAKAALQNALDTLPLRLDSSQFLIVEKRVYQVMVLPIKAPRLIAYSVIGFQLDQRALNELKQLTGLDISLFNQEALVITSLEDGEIAMGFWEKENEGMDSMVKGFQHPLYSHSIVRFGDSSDLSALLTASLEQENQEYYQLLYSVFFIAIVTLLVALVSIRLLSKSITTPLNYLLSQTQRIAQGQFDMAPNNQPQAREFSELETAFFNMGREISEREAEVVYQAEHDLLTGLYNRHTLRKKLDSALQNSAELLLLGVDIKAFKQLNDTMGPKVGDALLVTLAQRIGSIVDEDSNARPAIGFSGRISNDFFVLAVSHPSSASVMRYCEQVRKKINQIYEIDEMTIALDTCMGVVEHLEETVESEDLLRRVEIAVSSAKQEQKDIRFYQAGEDEEYLKRIAIIEELKSTLAADDGSLYMTYQPKLNLKTGKIDKLESLIRWVNKDGNFVNPELFIDLAEKSGLIVELTQWVVRSVLTQVAKWNEEGNSMKVAINMSAQDIQHEGFIEFMIDIIAEYRVSASQITLELTERDLINNESQVITRLNNLKTIGFEISIDDYGIGQSSLAKLNDLPANELKIDKSFIMTLDESDSDKIIVKSTIDLGHQLGMRVVAEGVENQASQELLKKFGCDHIQGFYLSKPIKADEFIVWLNSYEETNS